MAAPHPPTSVQRLLPEIGEYPTLSGPAPDHSRRPGHIDHDRVDPLRVGLTLVLSVVVALILLMLLAAPVG
jgi:hypothetical protein